VTIIWITLAIALLIVWVLSVVDIIRRHMGAQRTAAWLLIVILLPFIGSVVWWWQRKPTAEEIQKQAEATTDMRREAGRRGFDSRRF
jgi:hypothetical protein